MSEPQDKKPVDIIRDMNPGRFIPTGAELAKLLGSEREEQEGESEK